MKKIFICIVACTAVSFFGCREEKVITEENNGLLGFEWTKTERGFEIPVYAEYKQRVEGYKVTAYCKLDTCWRDYYCVDSTRSSGNGFLHFEKEGWSFTVVTEGFILPIPASAVKKGMTYTVDYVPSRLAEIRSGKIDMEDDNRDSPFFFFFFDIDFDGEKELIVRVREGMAYKGHDSFDAYKMPSLLMQHRLLSRMDSEPFDELDEHMTIDVTKKTITFIDGKSMYLVGRRTYGLVAREIFDRKEQDIIKVNVIELMSAEVYKHDFDGTGRCDVMYYTKEGNRFVRTEIMAE